MTTATVLLVGAIQKLRAAGIDDPARDARILLAHALTIPRDRLTLVMPDEVEPVQEAAFAQAIEARAARQPVAQIVGLRAFYGRDFLVTGDVLDPRPDTELLVETALREPFERVLDLGTGSGCILLTLLGERDTAQGIGTDISDKALAVARENQRKLGLNSRAQLVQGSWFDALADQKRFDLITSNPPYITQAEMADLDEDVHAWEPHVALTPGGDGLDAYRAITASVGAYLSPKGRLIVEIGKDQGPDVAALFTDAGLDEVQILQDLNGHDRVVWGRKSA